MDNRKLKYLTHLDDGEIEKLYNLAKKKMGRFVPMGTEVMVESSKRAGPVLEKEVTQKTKSDVAEHEQEQKYQEEDLTEERLQQMMMIVHQETKNAEALQTKHAIIDWEFQDARKIKSWKIIRVGNHIEVYQHFDDMLKEFDREDLVKLWCLVKQKFTSSEPHDNKERMLLVHLKRIFEPDEGDKIWKFQGGTHSFTWRLYDSCAIHHVSTTARTNIYMLVEQDYPLSRGTLTLMLSAKLWVDKYTQRARELVRKILMQSKRR